MSAPLVFAIAAAALAAGRVGAAKAGTVVIGIDLVGSAVAVVVDAVADFVLGNRRVTVGPGTCRANRLALAAVRRRR